MSQVEPLTPQQVATLTSITTATISTILFKRGLRNVWLRGPMPMTAGVSRVAGRAFTMRFVPAREDLSNPAAWSSPTSTRVAVEQMPEGCVAVVDALGCTDAGIFGDILCARMKVRQVAGLVTNGVVRDLVGVRKSELPTWACGTASPAAVASLTFVGWQQPIACGGVAVFPDDIIVADEDGAILIPPAYLEEILNDGPEQERFEAWVVDEVTRGAALPGLYPPNQESVERYQKSLVK
jgi:regulator of RNase E activity RraA